MTFEERLKYLITALNCRSITSFEDHLGISRKTFSKVIKEGTDTGYKNILKIWENFPNVNLHWLLTGCGNMFLDAESPKPYPENMGTHSLVSENIPSNLKDEYIKDLKDHIKTLKTEIGQKNEMIDMIKDGSIVIVPRDKH